MSLYAAGSIPESQDAWNQSSWQAASAGGQDVPKNRWGASPSSPFLGPSAFDRMLLRACLHAEDGSEGSSKRRGKSRAPRRGEDALAHVDAALEHVRLDLKHAAEVSILPSDTALSQLHVLRKAYSQLQSTANHSKKDS